MKKPVINIAWLEQATLDDLKWAMRSGKRNLMTINELLKTEDGKEIVAAMLADENYQPPGPVAARRAAIQAVRATDKLFQHHNYKHIAQTGWYDYPQGPQYFSRIPEEILNNRKAYKSYEYWLLLETIAKSTTQEFRQLLRDPNYVAKLEAAGIKYK